jgi:hypothetical protein
VQGVFRIARISDVGERLRRPVPGEADPARVDGQGVGGWHALHADPQGILAAHEVAGEHLGDHAFVGVPGDLGVGKDGLEFGAASERGCVGVVVERPDAQRIARAHEAPPVPVPEGDGEISHELAREGLSPALVGSQHQLGIVLRSEPAAPGDERGPELGAVVETPVHHDGQPSRGVAPGLALCMRFRRRPEGPVAEGDGTGRPHCLAVGPAVGESGEHPTKGARVGCPAGGGEQARNAAHVRPGDIRIWG